MFFFHERKISKKIVTLKSSLVIGSYSASNNKNRQFTAHKKLHIYSVANSLTYNSKNTATLFPAKNSKHQ